jgi:histidinol-phosphate/aromatic aminotransferase/cobyric acid decarboxylase-like protein
VRARVRRPGRHGRDPRGADVPLFRIAAELAGAEVGDDDPVLTFACRPNNPTGDARSASGRRPLVVDEAYFEYSGADRRGAARRRRDRRCARSRSCSRSPGARVGYALAAPTSPPS